jgi:hypothetical protein
MFAPAVQTSGTYEYLPTTGEMIMSAYARIQIKRTELTPTHLQDAIMEFNLLLASFNDAGPNLAQVDSQTVSLVAGTATYPILANTVMLLDVVMTYGGTGIPGASGTIDRYLYGLSRTEYVALPEKYTQGPPSQFWLDRTAAPTITFYPVPDTSGPYTVTYWRFRQVQDALLMNDLQPEVPNRAIDALIAGLAYRLARIWAPQLEQIRKADAGEAWAIFAKQDTENAPLYIIPGLAGYWRS